MLQRKHSAILSTFSKLPFVIIKIFIVFAVFEWPLKTGFTVLLGGKTRIKIRKRAKIRNRYNQAPHLTHDTNGKVTTSQFDITNESQELRPFPAGDHKASDMHESITKQDRNNINDPQKKHCLGTVSKILYWRA